MADPSPTQKLAAVLLGESAHDWILKRRAEGLSWRLVARRLEERTGGQIDVTYETLRAWAAEESDRVA